MDRAPGRAAPGPAGADELQEEHALDAERQHRIASPSLAELRIEDALRPRDLAPPFPQYFAQSRAAQLLVPLQKKDEIDRQSPRRLQDRSDRSQRPDQRALRIAGSARNDALPHPVDASQAAGERRSQPVGA